MPAEIKIIVSTSASGDGVSAVSRGLGELGSKATETQGAFSRLGDAATVALGSVMASAAQAGASAIVGFVSDSISAAGDFQAGLNEFAAVAGSGMAEAGLAVSDFSDLFLELGAKLPVSTQEVEAAATAMVKGGIEPAIVAAGGLESTLNFAAAASMGLEAAADLSAKMLGTFGDASMDATQKAEFLATAQNIMAQTANASTVDVEQLGDALLASAGAAQAIGQTQPEFTVAMGAIVGSFGSAAEAGTSYRNFLMRLQPSTAPALAAMQDLGLATEDGASKFYDAQGAFIGIEASAGLLQEAFVGLSDQQRTAAMQVIFGNDAMGAAAAYARLGAEGVAEFEASVAGANGVTEQAAAVNQGFNFAMANLSGTIESVQIKVGLLLLPILETLITTVNNVIGAVMGNTDAFAALPIPIQSVIVAIQGAIAFVQQMIASFTSGSAATGAWGGAFTQAQATITAVMDAVWAVVSAIGAQVLAFWEANGSEIMAFAQATWETIGAIVTSALQLIQTIATTVLTAVAGFITAHGADIQTIFNATWKNIETVVNAALSVIKGLINAANAVMKGDFTTAWNEIKGIVTTLIEAVKTVISNTLEAIKTIWNNNSEAIKTATTNAWEAVKLAISNAVEGAKTAAIQKFGEILSGLEGLGGRAAEAGRAFIGNMADGLMDAIGKMVNDAKAALAELADLLPGSEPKDPSSPLRGLGERGKALIDNIQTGINSAQLDLSGVVSQVRAQVDMATSLPQEMFGNSSSNRSTNNSDNRNITYAPNFGGGKSSPAVEMSVMRTLGRI